MFFIYLAVGPMGNPYNGTIIRHQQVISKFTIKLIIFITYLAQIWALQIETGSNPIIHEGKSSAELKKRKMLLS